MGDMSTKKNREYREAVAVGSSDSPMPPPGFVIRRSIAPYKRLAPKINRIGIADSTTSSSKRGRFDNHVSPLPMRQPPLPREPAPAPKAGPILPPPPPPPPPAHAGHSSTQRPTEGHSYMKSKAEEMRLQCEELNDKMEQLAKVNVELASLLLSLLEHVDLPGGGGGPGSLTNNSGGGSLKKAVLDRVNSLLVKAGLPVFPGAMGEILYNDLFKEYNAEKLRSGS